MSFVSFFRIAAAGGGRGVVVFCCLSSFVKVKSLFYSLSVRVVPAQVILGISIRNSKVASFVGWLVRQVVVVVVLRVVDLGGCF